MENFLKDNIDFRYTKAEKFLKKFKYPWQALEGLKEFIEELGTTLDKEEFSEIYPRVWVHKSAKLAPVLRFTGPCIIDEGTEVRQGAYIRGGVLVGKGCVVGNSTELKNAILFDGVQVPHFNYIGDSILGHFAHFGAGAITSNVKCDKSRIFVNGIATGLKKLGAIVGDRVEVGCNSVLNPGTVIGKDTVIYPLSSVRGIIPPDSIYKNGTAVKRV